MLEPSSSEDENDNVVEDDIPVVVSAPGTTRDTIHYQPQQQTQPSNLQVAGTINRSVSPNLTSSAGDIHPTSQLYPSNDRLALPQSKVPHHHGRSISPNPTVLVPEVKETVQLDEEEQAEKEEMERKTKLQLYVFVLRCISYPFNAKQPTDMSRRQMKVTQAQLEQITSRFQSFLKGEIQLSADEAFHNAIQNFYEAFLRSHRLQVMVQSGACSSHDFREVFRTNIDKRVRSLPEIDGLSKETVLNSWMTKFDSLFKGDEDSIKKPQLTKVQQQQQNLMSELILSKEQLYEMFQSVLNIKKFEHQLLYNALQVSFCILLN